jgi:hypothetical protein
LTVKARRKLRSDRISRVCRSKPAGPARIWHPRPSHRWPNRCGWRKALCFVPDVENIGVAVGLEKPRLAFGLALEEREGGGKGAFDFGLAAEFRDDGAVGRDMQQLVFAVSHFGEHVFGFVEEPVLEFGENGREFYAGVLFKIIPDDGRRGAGGNGGGFSRLKKADLGSGWSGIIIPFQLHRPFGFRPIRSRLQEESMFNR